LVQELIARLGDFGDGQLKELPGVEENIIFKLPNELKEAVRQSETSA